MFSWTWSVELSMALCKLEMFNLAINADGLFYFFKIFEVVNIWKSWMKTAGWRITWKMIFFHIILHPVVLIYDFHIHNFVIILSWLYNEPIQRPATSWLVSAISRVLHQYCRGQGFKFCTNLNFFRPSFRICKGCFYNCDDLLSYNLKFLFQEKVFFGLTFI